MTLLIVDDEYYLVEGIRKVSPSTRIILNSIWTVSLSRRQPCCTT